MAKYHIKDDLQQKLYIVTGANTGIGKVTALELAKNNAHVILACRTESKAMPVVEEIKAQCNHDNVEYMNLDLSDLDNVNAFVDAFLARDLPLHCLINNAGLAGAQGTTKQGFETTFGVNHLGHFLLTMRLLDKLKATATSAQPARIVNVASRAHTRTDHINFEMLQKPTNTTTGFPEYCVSKLANVLFNVELAKRLEEANIQTYALHPGVVASDVWRKVPGPIRFIMKRFMITNEEGAMTTLYCATSPKTQNETGLYYDKCKAVPTNPVVQNDPQLAQRLWALSEEWTQPWMS